MKFKHQDRWLGSNITKQFYLQFLYDSTAACVLVEDLNGQIIGCGTAKVIHRDPNSDNREGHILTLAVDPAFRRRGIGREILEVRLPSVFFGGFGSPGRGFSSARRRHLNIPQQLTLNSLIKQ